MNTDDIKVDLPLTRVMTQVTGEPLKDMINVKMPNQISVKEYEDMMEKAPPLLFGVFLSYVAAASNSLESLADMRRWFNIANDIFKTTEKKQEWAKGDKTEPEPTYLVNEKWITDVLSHVEKERKHMQQWNTAVFLGQVTDILEEVRDAIKDKVKQAKEAEKQKTSTQ